MSVLRAQPSVSLSLPSPTVAAGKPVLPRYVAPLVNTGTVKVGPGHLRPVAHSTGAGSAVSRPWTTRWSVDSLPDPGRYGGSYWLGERSSADGTLGLPDAAAMWRPDGTGPAWHSRFPFKPSVAAVNHYLFGGDVVQHPKGVNMNPHYIEHMWLDWGTRHRQPFTWLIAACVTSWDFAGQRHWLLDSGRDPRTGGAPNYSTAMVWQPRALKEDLGYRSTLAVNRDSVLLRTRQAGGQLGRAPAQPALHPKLYIGVFNGNQSQLGVWTPTSRRLQRVTVDNTAAQDHRYYVLGRRAGWLNQDTAGQLLVFELRYFNRALGRDDIREHYREMAAAYHFHRYSRS